MGCAAGFILILDQLTKWAVNSVLPLNTHRDILPGFFTLVHWGNTGAAWSLFSGKNLLLGCVGVVSLFALYFFRKHFEFSRAAGQLAMGMMMGGILGNLLDRFFRGHVVDFLYFYLITREGRELGYPAFNVADIGICVGVGVILLLGILRVKDENPSA